MISLQKKYANLENDFDNVNEKLAEVTVKLEASEKKLTEVDASATLFVSV